MIRVGDDFEREFEVDTFVPDTKIAYPIKWTTQADDGEHRASVELRYGRETATWDGEFRVGDEVRDELADRQVAPPEQEAGNEAGLPTAVIAGGAAAGAVLIVGGGYALGRLRRPRGRHFKR